MSRQRLVLQRYYIAKELAGLDTYRFVVRSFWTYADGFGYIQDRGTFDNKLDAGTFLDALNDQVSEP